MAGEIGTTSREDGRTPGSWIRDRAPRAEEGTTRKMKQREQARLGGRRGRCARQRKEEERRPWNRAQQEGPMAMELAGKERAQEDKADGHKKKSEYDRIRRERMTRGGKNQTSVLCLRRIFREKSGIIWIEGYRRSILESRSRDGVF
jgi:hypothetical protein